MVFSAISLLIVCILPGLHGICKFPRSLIGGQWLMSRSGARLTFNLSEVDGLYLNDSLGIKPPIVKQYDCVAAKENKYVIRSRKPSTIRKPRFVFICIHFLDITPNIVTFVQASITGPGIKPLFTKFDTVGAVGSDPIDYVCDLPAPYHPSRQHVLIREGSTLEHPCPDLIQGAWRSRGLCGTSLKVRDKSYIEVHYQNIDSCSRTAPFYPGLIAPQCVLSVQDDKNTYLTVYNANASVPFVCAVMRRSGEIIYMSHRARECSSRQTPFEGDGIFDFKCSVPSGCGGSKTEKSNSFEGEVMLLTRKDNSSNTIVVFITIVFVFILLYICTRRKKSTLKYFVRNIFKRALNSRIK